MCFYTIEWIIVVAASNLKAKRAILVIYINKHRDITSEGRTWFIKVKIHTTMDEL